MELIKVIALLCQISNGGQSMADLDSRQLRCHQYYVNCVSKYRGVTRTLPTDQDRLERCILEK